jgi:hypothetical protein
MFVTRKHIQLVLSLALVAILCMLPVQASSPSKGTGSGGKPFWKSPMFWGCLGGGVLAVIIIVVVVGFIVKKKRGGSS